MAKHLIKRQRALTDGNVGTDRFGKDGWLCEARINRNPAGSKVEVGDLVYVAEAGYAIFGSGTVKEVRRHTLNSAEEVLDFVFTKAQVSQDKYWMSQLEKVAKSPSASFHILEYLLVDRVVFEQPYLLQRRFLQQSSWYYLEDSFELETVELMTELNTKIPGVMRAEVYHKFSLQGKSHLIDIDHHVPKSVGGPGNIEENLVPIGLGLNRYKSDRIPSGLFRHAKTLGISLTPVQRDARPDLYLNDRGSKRIAKDLVREINAQAIDRARAIYADIRAFHLPAWKQG